jgi:hypothetical protein
VDTTPSINPEKIEAVFITSLAANVIKKGNSMIVALLLW